MPQANSDLVWQMCRDQLDLKLPDEWNCYARRDFTVLPADEFPAVYVVMQPEILLEEESDNRMLVGYPAGIVCMVKSAGMERDERGPLDFIRRAAQQALYTTSYAGYESVVLEQVIIDETVSAELPGDEEGITPTGFTAVLGLLEPREV